MTPIADNTGKRIEYLDCVKGYGICLMVLYHMHFDDVYFPKYIHSYIMPLFFIISGVLYNETNTIFTTIKNRARSLLIPYFFFGILYVIMYIVRNPMDNHEALRALLLFPCKGIPYESSLWFFPAMFWTAIVYKSLDHFIKNSKALTISVLLISVVTIVASYQASFRLPFGVDCALVAILFFHIGRVFKKRDILNHFGCLFERHILITAGAFLLFFIFVLTLALLNETINMRLMQWGNWPISIFCASFESLQYICFFFILCQKDALRLLRKCFLSIGMLSPLFVCINHPVIKIFRSLLSALGLPCIESRPFYYIYYIMIFLLSMLCMYFIAVVLFNTRLRVIFGKRP